MNELISRDKFNFANSEDTAVSTFYLIDRLQTLPEEHQVMALSSLFLLICKRYNVSPNWALEHVDRVMKDHEDNRYWARQWTAIEEYLEKELP
jgi:hypothetical protein